MDCPIQSFKTIEIGRTEGERERFIVRGGGVRVFSAVIMFAMCFENSQEGQGI